MPRSCPGGGPPAPTGAPVRPRQCPAPGESGSAGPRRGPGQDFPGRRQAGRQRWAGWSPRARAPGSSGPSAVGSGSPAPARRPGPLEATGGRSCGLTTLGAGGCHGAVAAMALADAVAVPDVAVGHGQGAVSALAGTVDCARPLQLHRVGAAALPGLVRGSAGAVLAPGRQPTVAALVEGTCGLGLPAAPAPL